MAKRRARIEARVSKIKRKPVSDSVEEAPAAPAAASVRRKLQKRVRFLEGIKTSALAARAAVFKRKRKAQGVVSLEGLGDALPELASLSPGTKKAAPQFLARGSRVVRKGTRMKVCAAETTRFAAVLSNSVFQDDPIAAVCNHVLAQLPPKPSAAVGMEVQRPQKRSQQSKQTQKGRR